VVGDGDVLDRLAQERWVPPMIAVRGERSLMTPTPNLLKLRSAGAGTRDGRCPAGGARGGAPRAQFRSALDGR
jgi:hypothetical protein